MLTFFDRPGNVEPIRILLRMAKVDFYDNIGYYLRLFAIYNR